MIPPLADKQHISVMVDLSGIYEGSNSNAMHRFGLLPTIVSPPGLCLNFTRFLKVMIGKIVSHSRKTSYNNLPNLVLRLNLPNPINFHFGNISGEQRAQVRPVRGHLVRLARPNQSQVLGESCLGLTVYYYLVTLWLSALQSWCSRASPQHLDKPFELLEGSCFYEAVALCSHWSQLLVHFPQTDFKHR